VRRLRRLGLDPVPTSREEVLRKSTQFSPAAMVNMFCLLLPTSYIPTTSFFHDFSGAAFNNDERSLLGLGINYGLPPVTAFNTDPVFGVKEDFTLFSRDVFRHDAFVQQAIHIEQEWTGKPPDPAPISALNVPSFWDPSVDCPDYKPTVGVPQFLDKVWSAIEAAIETAPPPRKNLSRRHLDCLLRLQHRHDLVFVLTDKNLGMACDTRSAYKQHCLDSLAATHERTDMSLDGCVKHMQQSFEMTLSPFLEDMTAGSGITEPLPDWMQTFLSESFRRIPTTGGSYKVPKFYLLYKVHKDVLGFRPITGNFCSPSQPASRLLAFLLEPLVRYTDSYVRDADHLSVCLHETSIGPHDILVTYDIVNLYPSIPHELCTDMVAQHLRKVRTNVDFLEIGSMLSDDFILTMLRLVLRLNFCTFMGVVYRQIVGYATGTACGGQVAHLYLEELLGPIIAAAAASIVIHKRYIDDGFLVWRGTAAALNLFLQRLGSVNDAVRITHAASASSAIFLDLRFSRTLTGELATDVYQKPINKYLYPLWSSEIPRDTLAGICIGEVIRYIKRCSSRHKFVRMLRLLTDRLRARGWPDWFIRLAMSRAPLYDERADLLRRSVPSLNYVDMIANLGPRRFNEHERTFALILDYSSAAANAFSFPKRFTDLLPPAFRQARFVTAWRKPRKLGDKLRYRITTEESASSLALANDDSADAAEESVEEMFEGSDDADFF
jgi:hypothetical protein